MNEKFHYQGALLKGDHDEAVILSQSSHYHDCKETIEQVTHQLMAFKTQARSHHMRRKGREG